MKVEHALALTYFLVNVVLYLSYFFLWNTREITGTVFFTQKGFEKLKTKVCCLQKHYWVLLLASMAFLVNVIFVSIIGFDSNAWNTNHLETLRATISLQIAYFFLQWFYIPFLLAKTKKFLLATQILLGVCALLQITSAIIAGVHGKGVAKYLNIYPALWTTIFDFAIYSLPKPKAKLFDSLQKYTMSLYDYADSGGSQSEKELFL